MGFPSWLTISSYMLAKNPLFLFSFGALLLCFLATPNHVYLYRISNTPLYYCTSCNIKTPPQRAAGGAGGLDPTIHTYTRMTTRPFFLLRAFLVLESSSSPQSKQFRFDFPPFPLPNTFTNHPRPAPPASLSLLGVSMWLDPVYQGRRRTRESLMLGVFLLIYEETALT